MTSKCAFSAQRNKLTIHGERGVWQLASEAGVRKQVADAPFNVNP